MTQEQYEVLKQYRRNLIMAHKSKQISALTSGDVLKLATVFEAEGYTLSCRSCGHSVLSMCAKLGELLLRYEEEHKEPEYVPAIPEPRFPEPEPVEEPIEPEPIPEPVIVNTSEPEEPTKKSNKSTKKHEPKQQEEPAIIQGDVVDTGVDSRDEGVSDSE